MSLLTLKEYIYSTLCMGKAMENGMLLEAMMNSMQAVFVCLQSGPTLDRELLLKGQGTFHTFLGRYFTEAMEVRTYVQLTPSQSRLAHEISGIHPPLSPPLPPPSLPPLPPPTS